MFVYGVCVGPSNRFSLTLEPSLKRHGLGPVITRYGQRSIFDAYDSMLDEAVVQHQDLERVAFIHEDVYVQDPGLEDRMREALGDPEVGLVGVVGGSGHREMSWWKTSDRQGHVRHATHTDDFSRGIHEVGTVDGLIMVVSPTVARRVRMDGRRYPGFHGYDSELCALVRETGLRVIVADLDVFHDCKVTDWSQPTLWWAAFEWALRWRRASLWQRTIWRAKRAVFRVRASDRRLSRSHFA